MHGINRISAKISKAVYNEPQFDQINAGYSDLEGWEFIQSSAPSSDGYFGAAFAHNGTILIASRGIESSDPKDLENALHLILDQEIKQLHSAIAFASLVQSTRHVAEKWRYVFIGHSLGGLLAQISSIKLGCRAITFDSPGAYKVASRHFARKSFDTSHITSFVSAPNVINTNGKHITKKLIKINFYSDPGHAHYIDYLRYSLNQHSIENIMHQFDYATDAPKQCNFYTTWPSGKLSGYKHYLQNNLKKRNKEPGFLCRASL